MSVWAVDFDTDLPPPGRQEPLQLPGDHGVNPFGSRGLTRSHGPPAAGASILAAGPSASALTSGTAAAAAGAAMTMAAGQDTAVSQLSVAAAGSDSAGRDRGGLGKGPEDASGKVGCRTVFRGDGGRESERDSLTYNRKNQRSHCTSAIAGRRALFFCLCMVRDGEGRGVRAMVNAASTVQV